ncbi:MAG: anthranilate synthase component I family protein [Flavobacteriia bacterium]|jgi:para-aminobenzoate synthetase component 1
MNSPIIYLNSNDGSGLLAFGEGERISGTTGSTVEVIQQFLDQHKGKYIFGYFSYDLNDKLAGIPSGNTDRLKFPDLFLWVPAHVVQLDHENIRFLQGEKDPQTLEFVSLLMEEETDHNFHTYHFDFRSRISKKEYIEKVNFLKEHIQQGNIYEVNFCQEYYAENVDIPFELDAYFKLNQLTLAPNSAFMQWDEYMVLCGSPERFLKKEGTRLTSQPIKGTAARGENEQEDEANKKALFSDKKERSENIMIVDLVRNDLSRIAEPNSVQVDELCGIYTFETVHQMISTVSCEVKKDIQLTDILKATFPMGSMTGTPKLRAMELIEETESFKRGLYSGSIGYITPDGDFDLNVVIRSFLYNKNEKYLSCSVGSAITIKSDPEKEYEECQIKVKRLMDGMNA